MTNDSVCVKGKNYGWFLDKLKCIGWDAPDGYDLSGYNCWDYFDAEGVYLGPDEYGVEPIFDQDVDVHTALVLALKVALTAPTEERYQEATDFAEKLISDNNLSKADVARAWKEADTTH